jgi:hypothetical protein
MVPTELHPHIPQLVLVAVRVAAMGLLEVEEHHLAEM